MEKIQNLLFALNNKYNDSIPLLQILAKKYSLVEDENKQEQSTPEVLNGSKTILSNNVDENENFVKKLIDSTDNLIKQLHLSEDDVIPAKILTEYRSQLVKIPENKLISGEKFADSLCKCIKKTILKLFNVKNYGIEIMNYLRSNGFSLVLFERGHKLSDDDLCLLDENLLQAYKVVTVHSDNNYRVIDMVQPIIRIFYVDEDDEKIYSRFLPGICKYYVKEAQK